MKLLWISRRAPDIAVWISALGSSRPDCGVCGQLIKNLVLIAPPSSGLPANQKSVNLQIFCLQFAILQSSLDLQWEDYNCSLFIWPFVWERYLNKNNIFLYQSYYSEKRLWLYWHIIILTIYNRHILNSKSQFSPFIFVVCVYFSLYIIVFSFRKQCCIGACNIVMWAGGINKIKSGNNHVDAT